ncbi:MAG: 4'-phosphopantetheinyl transferase superfamily protein [Flavobacterium sp.]
MIGNDVVDIIQSRHESNWQRKGFIQKLFTIEEQSLISTDLNPEIMVWLLWSMKEAAYKIYNRQTKIREYIPKKLSCSLHLQNINYSTGQVNCGENIYYTKTTISKECIHTIAVNDPENFNYVTEIQNEGIIKDQYGIPHLHTPLSHLSHDVSISHHGSFEKVVCLLKT